MKIEKVVFKKAGLFLGILFFISYSLNAQWYDSEKVNKKAAAIYEAAYKDAMDQNYMAAIAAINKAVSIEPKFVEAYLSKAGIYAELKKYDSSVIDFEKALQLDAVYAKTYLLPYSISLAGTGQFQKAFDAVTEFLVNPTLNAPSIKAGNYRKSTYQFAIEYQKRHPSDNYVFARKNLGDSVNSDALEYYPSLTIDGKKLIFTRRIAGDEDFFESNSVNGKWGKATALGGRVNTNLNEGAQNISQDGEWIIFTGCNYPEGEGSCDLYISYKTKNGWSEAENIGPVINTDFWESSPSLSPDKRDLYFSSNQAGTYGGKDIWVTHRNTNGKWSRPENLGPAINTSGDESCSFMYADNQTLFFNSNGHPGYGASDLFFSKKLSDSSWSIPENLGYPINTIDEEGSLIVAADGKTAYYASEGIDSKAGLDLYSFQLREDLQPPRTLWVKGKVYDAKTKNGLPSSVELTDINSRRLISKVQTDEDGNYLTTLPVGKDYAFNVNRKGYLFFSENYNISTSSDSVYTADIPLQPIEAGAAIILKNIFFDTKKTELKPESIVELTKVIQLMNDNPNLKILISGFTDNVGQLQDNLLLSKNRSLAVINYLLSNGQIAKDRLQYKGLGAAKPIADNTTEQGKALNRRTELSVVSN
jgi:outer membrane protein OmpA-like peptidoglycan-associated protein/tetratricopeptide (TPR) repeat protein